MAGKLYWTSATITNAGGTSSPAVIKGLIVSDDKITQEDERATIEDNQEIQIQLSGGMSLETAQLNVVAGTAILSDARVNTEGGDKARLVLTAQDGSTATLDNVYLNARKKIISTGEVGIMLDAKRSDAVDSDPVAYA